MTKSKRDYKKEYAKFHKSRKSKTDRAARNKASRKKSCPSGKEVHHKEKVEMLNFRNTI